MITIIFESHTKTFDNEQKIASGHFDAELSPLGIQQARELGRHRAHEHFDAIFTSDLRRAYKTAAVAFGGRFPIIQDSRLREADYGDFTHRPKEFVNAERPKRINIPFPNGETYNHRMQLIGEFLKEIQATYDGKRILIIGHRATKYGLDHWVNKEPLEAIMAQSMARQLGWVYDTN